MVSNFELLMDFKNIRDFAICASKNNLCCNKTRCSAMLQNEKAQERCCRLCWLDFLTNTGLAVTAITLQLSYRLGSEVKSSTM